MMNRFSNLPVLLLLSMIITACVPVAVAEGDAGGFSTISVALPTVNHWQTHVETMPLEGEPVTIEGGHAELLTTEYGATMRLYSPALEPGEVYTAWWVIINHPENCDSSPCSPEDILGNTNGVDAEITRADGQIADANGAGEFTGFLAKGAVANPWFGNGFIHPQTAEIHIVLNQHGPLIPELAANMLNSYRGGCSDDSLPPPFPDTAKADGEPGPNACQLVQDAIFLQKLFLQK